MLKSRGGTPVFTCDGDDRRILLSLKFSIRRDFEGWENWARIFFGVACRFNEGFFFGIHGSACLSRPRSSTNNVTPNNVNIPYYLMLSGNF